MQILAEVGNVFFRCLSMYVCVCECEFIACNAKNKITTDNGNGNEHEVWMVKRHSVDCDQ